MVLRVRERLDVPDVVVRVAGDAAGGVLDGRRPPEHVVGRERAALGPPDLRHVAVGVVEVLRRAAAEVRHGGEPAVALVREQHRSGAARVLDAAEIAVGLVVVGDLELAGHRDGARLAELVVGELGDDAVPVDEAVDVALAVVPGRRRVAERVGHGLDLAAGGVLELPAEDLAVEDAVDPLGVAPLVVARERREVRVRADRRLGPATDVHVDRHGVAVAVGDGVDAAGCVVRDRAQRRTGVPADRGEVVIGLVAEAGSMPVLVHHAREVARDRVVLVEDRVGVGAGHRRDAALGVALERDVRTVAGDDARVGDRHGIAVPVGRLDEAAGPVEQVPGAVPRTSTNCCGS